METVKVYRFNKNGSPKKKKKNVGYKIGRFLGEWLFISLLMWGLYSFWILIIELPKLNFEHFLMGTSLAYLFINIIYWFRTYDLKSKQREI